MSPAVGRQVFLPLSYQEAQMPDTQGLVQIQVWDFQAVQFLFPNRSWDEVRQRGGTLPVQYIHAQKIVKLYSSWIFASI